MGWDKKLETMTATFAGQKVSEREFIEQAEQAGYTDFFELPAVGDRLFLCMPERGLDGPEISLERESPLAQTLIMDYTRNGRVFGMPYRYPYHSDRRGALAALEAGIPIPAEIMMQYPDLLAQFGL